MAQERDWRDSEVPAPDALAFPGAAKVDLVVWAVPKFDTAKHARIGTDAGRHSLLEVCFILIRAQSRNNLIRKK